jgi:hypothetical protein
MQELLPFDDLINAVKEELHRVKYREKRIELYRSIWEVLRQYVEEKDLRHFDMKIGLNL